jgi:hypothetical protein
MLLEGLHHQTTKGDKQKSAETAKRLMVEAKPLCLYRTDFE